MLLCLLIFTALAISTFGEDDKYTTKYDNFDIDSLMTNDRLLQKYVQCLLDLATCTADGLELKKNMPDALQTNCSKCSKKQKNASDQLILFLIENKPQYWEPLKKKYDSTGEYTTKFLEERKSKSQDKSD
ncbi:hypothetical protein Trydic_g4504 [Trypoxylus dichotomus]